MVKISVMSKAILNVRYTLSFNRNIKRKILKFNTKTKKG